MTKPILIVQGAQWGSEGKGQVAAALCQRRKVDYAVRTGGVNAGHTVYYEGKKYVNQQLPTGWVNEGTVLVIGPGAYVNPYILLDEIGMILGATGELPNVVIDNRAGLHLPDHTERAKMSGRHYRIGATAKGCSEAIVDRIRLRGSGGMLFKDWANENWSDGGWRRFSWGDAAELLNGAYDAGKQILLEGTQGTLLDLYLGPYPYVTHKQTTAAQWIAEAGLSPALGYEVVLVARTYPIRVAGNSGPMANEIDWPTLAREINNKLLAASKPDLVDSGAVRFFESEYAKLGEYPYASPEVEASERNGDAWRACPPDVQQELAKLFEFTTVTKKLRRVARLSIDDLKYSVMVNRPSWIAMTFLNYEFPDLWGAAVFPNTGNPWHPFYDYVNGLTDQLGVPLRGVSLGPESQHFLCGAVSDYSRR